MKNLELQDWDRDKTWKNIELSLKKKKKRRFLWWLWLGISGTTLFFLFLYLNYGAIRSGQPVQITKNIPSLYKTNKTKQLNHNYSSLDSSDIINQRADSLIKVDPSQSLTSEVIHKKPIAIPENTSKLDNRRFISVIKLEKIHPQLSALKRPFESLSLLPLDTFLNYGPKDYYHKVINWQLPFLASKDFSFIEFERKITLPLALDSILNKSSNGFNLRIGTSYSRGEVQHQGPQEWVTIKEDSESFEWATTHHVTLDWHLSKNWYAYAGIDYQILVNQYNYTTTNESITEIASDSATVFSLSGQSYFQPGFLQKTVTTKRSIGHNNFLHRWFFNFGFGLEQSFGKYRLNGRLGPRILFAQSFDGISLNEESAQHILENRTSNRSYYQTNINVGLKGTVSIDYHFSLANALFVGFQFEEDDLYTFRPVRYNSNYQLWGIQLGWKYRLSLRK